MINITHSLPILSNYPNLNRNYEKLLQHKTVKKIRQLTPQLFFILGSTLTLLAGGLGLLSLSFVFKPLTSVFLITTAFTCLTLSASCFLFGNSALATSRHFETTFKEIQKFKENGHYRQALTLARQGLDQAQKIGTEKQIKHFTNTVKDLEKEVLYTGTSRILFDQNFKPKEKLLHLLRKVGMQEAHPTIQTINSWAQGNLLRQGERWQEQTTHFESLKVEIHSTLVDLGFIEGVSPSFNTYDGAIINGALLSRMRLRLHHLIEQWKSGIRFTHLYFLSGERPLEAQFENRDTLSSDHDSPLKIRQGWQMPNELPQTECEIARLIWEQAEIPTEMREQLEGKVHFINAPKKPDPKNPSKLLRPTTDDTVITWLKESPKIGRYLVISNGPYINRQDIVIRALSPKNYGFDTIGEATSSQEKMLLILDELARLIFQINQLANKH